MRYFNRTVFDGVIAVAANSGAVAQYSRQDFNALLGSCETLALHIHATGESGSPVVTVTTEGSNDGQEWLPVNTSIPTLSPVAGTSTAEIWNDSTTPRMAFMRCKVSTSAGQAKVRIIACGRGAL